MSTLVKRAQHTKFQSLLLLGLLLFFVGHLVLLNPSSLEDDFGGIRIINPKDLLTFLKNDPPPLAEGVPVDVAPSYSLRDALTLSSKGVKPSTKMNARKANVYSKENIIHARDVVIELEDHTIVRAKEAIDYTEKNQVNFYGSVHTTFTNGAEVFSEFATVFTKPVTHIIIPVTQQARGRKDDKKTLTEFTSQGLDYTDAPPKELHLLSNVVVDITEEDQKKSTRVISDQATYNQDQGHLHFFMNETRPLKEQFVFTHRVDLDVNSRTLEVYLNEKKELEKIVALRDVWIKDSHDPLKISTSTSGKAVFIEAKNDVILSDFPQVYQEGDTITGDIIIDHRTTDLIEVKQSNAIYNTEQEDEKSNGKSQHHP